MIYAVGDIHGEAESLRALLRKLPLGPSDLVTFLGDAINRGPDSFGCIEQILAFDRCRKIFLQGNHEEALLVYLEDGNPEALSGMGAEATFESYAAAGYRLIPGDMASIPETHLRLYAQAYVWTLPFYITDDYIFTHSGWNLSVPLHQQNTGVMRWGKVTGAEAPVWTQTIVRGHTPFPKVTFARNKRYIGVDTGCGHGGFLSAIALPSQQIYSSKPASFRPEWLKNFRR